MLVPGLDPGTCHQVENILLVDKFHCIFKWIDYIVTCGLLVSRTQQTASLCKIYGKGGGFSISMKSNIICVPFSVFAFFYSLSLERVIASFGTVFTSSS
jgi:hypothetical protein